MHKQKTQTQTKTSKTQNTSSNFIQTNLFTFFATLSGVVIGVLASLAMVAPALQSEVASATTRGLHASLASDTTPAGSCSLNSGSGAGSGSGGAATVQTASATMPEAVGSGGGGSTSGSGSNTWVQKFVGGQMTTTTASISGDNQDTHNSISTTNKNITVVKNDNDVTLKNDNPQLAKSGDATTQDNNGGNATSASGDAKNNSDATFSVNITN